VGDIFWQPWHSGVEEWYTEDFSSYQTCTSNNGEDPDCSDGVSLLDCSIDDHLHYFGVEVGDLCDSDNGMSKHHLKRMGVGKDNKDDAKVKMLLLQHYEEVE